MSGQEGKPDRLLKAVARRRTLLLVILPLIGMLVAEPRPALYLVGVMAVVAGQAMRFWAAGYIVKATQLTTTGPYAHVRNPLYLGSLLITLGWGTMSGRLVVAVVLLAVFALTHALAIRSEESYLGERFGEEFDDYCRRVPRLFPRLRPGASGSGNYSWRRALQCDGEGWTSLGVAALAGLYATRFWW
ncbi:MAG TPA: isoprenylcysteine carboxylmethyltransferase family protein [Armatimonadetes bacterium]|jgi:protein-S-isoprenylcysteine O-methyltransferase Ste14|nr:isoprenylcysteine carboxylmethyltransferase family protein [Armatimonadota bacterium]